MFFKKNDESKIIKKQLKKFANKLEAKRKRSGMSMTELSEYVGVSQATISFILRGKSTNLEHYGDIANILGVRLYFDV